MKFSRLNVSRNQFRIFLLVAGLSAFVATSAKSADDPPLLRYGWQANQTYAFKVEIVASNKDSKETLSGMPQFAVKSVAKDNVQIQISGENLASRRESAGIRAPRFPRFGTLGASGHQITLDLRGRIVKESGDSRLPYLLGDLQELILPQLPEKAEKTWKQSRELVIRVSQPGRIPSPLRGDVELKRMNAEETNEFTIESLDEKSVTLKRKYSLKTVETVEGEAAIEATGEAKIVFDRARGVPTTIEYSGKVVERETNSESRIPLKIEISLVSAEELAKLTAEAAAKAAELKAPPTAAERAEILENVQSTDFGKWLRSLQMLRQKQPEAADPEMGAALAAQLLSGDVNRRVQLAGALENWATENEVPTLIKAIDDSNQVVANSAMTALGRLKAAAAIEPLVKQLDKQGSRISAGKALRQIGAPAETAVQKALDSNDWTTRLEGVAILSEIGSAASKEALKSRADNDSNALIRQRAKDALDKIGKTEGAKP